MDFSAIELPTTRRCTERDPTGTIQVRMNNVTTEGLWDWSSFIRVPIEENNGNVYVLQPGDVLFNNTNSTELVGKTALFYGNDEPVVFSNHFTRLRTDRERLEPAYLAYWLLKLWKEGEFARLCDKWIGQSAVQRSKILGLRIPLHRLQEQKRIAGSVREQLAEAERSRGAVGEQLKAADALPAAFLRTIFSNPATHWPLRRLGDVLRLRKDIIHPRNLPTGKATFVGLEHIESHTGRRIGSDGVEMAALTGRKPQFFQGDIVYGYLRPYLNKVWIAEFDGLCSVDQYVYSVKPEADKHFVAWFMRSSVYLERAPIADSPGQLPRIRTEEVAAVEIELPPPKEQQRLAAKINAHFREAQSLREHLAQKLSSLEKMPAALLREAFNGKM